VAQQAQQEALSYESYLLELATRECQERRHKRIERLLRESRLPLEKNLQTFELKRLPAKVLQQVRALLSGGFVDRRENVLAFGQPGSGKTHLLCALAQELVRAGRPAGLIQSLQPAGAGVAPGQA
jgi:DNA replication protein DnaC